MRSASSDWCRRARHPAAVLLAAFLVAGAPARCEERPDAPPPPPPLADGLARALETIRAEDILAHARALSDRRYRGRRAGSRSGFEAAGFVVRQFHRAGLLPGGDAGGYFQSFPLGPGFQIAGTLALTSGGVDLGPLRRGEHYMPVHAPDASAEIAADVVCAGYGIASGRLGLDEYEGLEVAGKTVLLCAGVPWARGRAQWPGLLPEDDELGAIDRKALAAAERGAVCVLFVADPAGWRTDAGLEERLCLPDPVLTQKSRIPLVQITIALAGRLTGGGADGLRRGASDVARRRAGLSRPLDGARIRFSASISGTPLMGRNVVGVLPGRGGPLAREAVVVGAHYDHLGEGIDDEVYAGANDNAAGVGALAAVAGAFAALPTPPRRTVVFVSFDAEECGLQGSRSYVARPAVAIERTAFMVNFDMVGANEPDHVYAVGSRSSDRTHALHQEMNRYVGLRLTHPESYRLGRSDHTAFYCAGVPIIYFFGGLTAEYNTPQDTWERLIPGKLEKVARLAFLTAYRVAEDEERPAFSDGAPAGIVGAPVP